MNQFYVNIIIALVIMASLAYRLSRERKFPMGSLWLWPGLIFIFAVADIAYERVYSPLAIVYMLLGMAVGVAVGWYQGVHSTIRVDTALKAAFVKASPFGALIFVAAIAFRSGARYMTGGMASPDASGHLSPLAALISGVALTFAVGVLGGLRLYVKRAYDESPA